MSLFVRATAPPQVKTGRVKQVALLYAIILTAMALAQLYTFEEFIELTTTFQLPLPETLVYLVAPLLIICEVLALPFLLRMYLSPAFRVISMVCSWLVSLKWLCITIWVVTSAQQVTTIGFLSTIGDLTPGWWAVLVSVSFGILAAWVSWGMWPFSLRKSSAKSKL
jgi:hypothetical protein